MSDRENIVKSECVAAAKIIITIIMVVDGLRNVFSGLK